MLYSKHIIILSLVFFSALVTAADTDLLGVSVKPLSSVLIESKQSSPASIVNLNTSVISAEITGRAFKVNAEIGDTVKAGQTLVVLDCRSYELSRKQAEASLKVSVAQLNLAQKQLQRNQRLLAQGTIPRELFENTQASQESSLADIDVKKAQIETAKLAIDRCTIKAPFDSQISNRMVQQGQLLQPGSALFELIQTNKSEIKTNLSPNNIAAIKALSVLEFVTNDQSYKAKIRTVIQRVDETTRTQEVRLSLTDESVVLPAGLSGRIQWSDNKPQIPPEYILRNNTNLGVMIAEDDKEGITKAKFIRLENATEGQPAFTDLPNSTMIIDKNRYRVTDGELINIQKE